MSDRNSIIRYSHRLVIIALSVVLMWTGLIKLLDLESFALAVYRYHLLPSAVVNVFALWIVGLELVCAVLLLLRKLRKATLFVMLGMLIVFSIAISTALIRGDSMACGCFSTSPLSDPLNWLGVVKNAGLIALALFAIRVDHET